MGTYNKDGFISGGFIFDELDKFAQQMVEHRSEHKYNFTHFFCGGFWKQLCEVDYYNKIAKKYCESFGLKKNYAFHIKNNTYRFKTLKEAIEKKGELLCNG